MKKIMLTVLSVILVLSFIGCASAPKTVEGLPEGGPILASYIRTWPIGSTEEAMTEGVHWTVDDIQGQKMTDLIIAFALIQDGSGIYVKDIEDVEGPAGIKPGFTDLFEQIAAVQAKFPDLNVSISIGGWGADGFSDMALDPVLRAEFVANVMDWLVTYDFDGVDIDWEYPVGPPWGGLPIVTRPEDKDTYPTLLQDLRDAMDALGAQTGKTYTLSTAVPASGWFIEAVDVVKVAQIVDRVKIMSYDYYGGWSGQTGHSSNLYTNPADPDWGGFSSDAAINLYLNAGVPADKIVFGVVFFGRAWKGVEPGPNGDGLYQKYAATAYDHGVMYTDIQEFLKEGSGYTRYWDDVAKTPYLYNGDTFITYTDAEAMALAADYVEEMGLAGLFTWEYAHDLTGTLLNIMKEGLYPEVE